MNKDERNILLAECEGLTWPQLADKVYELRNLKADLKKRQTEIQKQLEVVCREVIPDRMAEEGLRGIPLTDGSRLELRSYAFCSVKAGQKENLFNWLSDHDHGDLISEVVNPSTLKAFIKEQLEAGNEVPPDDVVSYDPYVEATLVGRK